MTTSVGSGIGSSLGFAAESPYGTFAASTRWVEFESESLTWVPKRMQGLGLYNGGQFQRDDTRVQTTETVNGDIKTAFYAKGMGLWLGNVFGGSATPVSTSGHYVQTHTWGDLYGHSLAIQKGVPQLNGTIERYNFLGNKVIETTFECGVDEYLMATFKVDGQTYEETSAYGSPTYLTANPPFSFNGATFKMGAYGSEVAVGGVRKFTLSIKRPLRVDNFYLDGTGLKHEPVMNGFAEITGTLETDYVDKTAFVDMFVADTAQSIVMQFLGPNIPSTSVPYSLTLNVPNVRWDADMPLVGGPDIVQPKMTFTYLYDLSHLPSAVYVNTDSSL